MNGASALHSHVMPKMRYALIAVLAAVTFTIAAPVHPQFDDAELVARLCGKLERVDRIPDKRIPGKYTEKYFPFKDTKLVAYERTRNVTCCKTATVAAETRSGKSGDFEFKGLPTGDYWLVANVDPQEYRMAIRVQKLKDKQPVCSQMSFAIGESGDFSLRFSGLAR